MTERVSDKIVFDATDVERGIIDILPRLTSPRRWPAFNAVRHLNRAWRLAESDQTVALFYAITAEEEAATALLQSLRHWRYPLFEKINPRNHVHKNAVIPFFDGMTRILETLQDPPKLRFILQTNDLANPLVLEIELPHPEHGLVWCRPQPPLGIQPRRSVDGGATYSDEDFARGFAKVAQGASVATVGEYLRRRANLRNVLLYASADGYPDYQGDVQIQLREFKRHVFASLRMFLLVEPYPEHQSFVVQAVSGFVGVITNLGASVEFQ